MAVVLGVEVDPAHLQPGLGPALVTAHLQMFPILVFEHIFNTHMMNVEGRESPCANILEGVEVVQQGFVASPVSNIGMERSEVELLPLDPLLLVLPEGSGAVPRVVSEHQ